MARKGISVKELARELGLTSRSLIDRCRAEGIAVQNSITKLDRTAERTVRAWYTVAGGAENDSPLPSLEEGGGAESGVAADV